MIELREDRSLFSSLMVVRTRRPDIDLEEAIGKYEFSVVPRSMFAQDDTVLHCSAKSVLITILVRLGGESQQRTTTEPQFLGIVGMEE